MCEELAVVASVDGGTWRINILEAGGRERSSWLVGHESSEQAAKHTQTLWL